MSTSAGECLFSGYAEAKSEDFDRRAVGSAPFTDFCTFAIGRDGSAGVKTSCTRLRWPDALDGSFLGRLQWRLRFCAPPPVQTWLGELG
jgi:hypothetical protein